MAFGFCRPIRRDVENGQRPVGEHVLVVEAERALHRLLCPDPVACLHLEIRLREPGSYRFRIHFDRPGERLAGEFDFTAIGTKDREVRVGLGPRRVQGDRLLRFLQRGVEVLEAAERGTDHQLGLDVGRLARGHYLGTGLRILEAASGE